MNVWILGWAACEIASQARDRDAAHRDGRRGRRCDALVGRSGVLLRGILIVASLGRGSLRVSGLVSRRHRGRVIAFCPPLAFLDRIVRGGPSRILGP